MAQLGRIGGHLLDSTLTREGVDLAFKNTTFDATPILQLDVENGLVGIKTDAPLYELDIRTDVKTTNSSVTQFAKIDGVTVNKTTYYEKFATATTRSVQITVTSNTPATLYIWCKNHSGMGNSITVAEPGAGGGGASNPRW